MIITKNILAEQIQRIYVRFLHRDNLSPTLDKREVIPLIEHAANELLRLQAQEGFTNGNIDIPQGSLATYTVPLTGVDNKYATCELPVYPVRIAFDIGIWKIYDPADPWTPFIPIIQMDSVLVTGNPANYLEQQVGYYVEGKLIRFTKDLTIAPYSLTEVSIVLLINDFSQYDENDLLPITPDLGTMILRNVIEALGLGAISQAEMKKMEEQELQLTDGENKDN